MIKPTVAAPALRRVAMLSVHSSPLATLGGQVTGGMNVYVRELSRQLSRHGIAVDVYTRRQDPDLPEVLEFDQQARVVHLNAGPPVPYPKHEVFGHMPEFVSHVQSFIAKEGLQYDCIHSHYWVSGWVALRLRQSLQVPVVHMSHTLGYPKNSAVQQAWEREPPTRLQVEYEVLKHSDHLIAESQASKDHMVQDYGVDPARIEIIPCGVETSIFHPHDRQQARRRLGLPGGPLLLFIGRLQPLKGIDTLLKCAYDVRQRHDDLQVLIVGGGVDTDDPHERQERERLHALMRELGLTGHVRFIDAQPQEQLAYYYAAADLLMMPSHYESFGMVVLEAMACGTPVVASHVGGLASTVLPGQTGFLAPVGDEQAFARSVEQLIGAPELWQSMSEAAYLRAQAYTWPRIMKRTLQLYRELQGQNTARQGSSAAMAASGLAR
ncbi:glycosyltransferase [Candidatus Entotheonella palauensis]|nr:glycosyltransferase [Candidatus Entotheonella palauensis]